MTETARLHCRPADIERALRGVGLSRKQAQRLMAGGLPALGQELPEDDQPRDEVRALVTELREAARLLRGEGGSNPSDASP